ncbi:MAG: pyridoxamine 5'-phosphate oxidase family protein [Desulfatirhabdiaceae bacterium]|nr:pyridoxamine 5'-phosphate oxidase family protein [Desulfatirhabdiaceae bacterium]
MRRKDKEMTDPDAVASVIRRSTVCRLGMSDDNQPYVVPMSFGYKDGAVYFHCATEGRKIEFLRKNPRVCIEFDVDCRLKTGDSACKWGFIFQSAIAFGVASFIEGSMEKRAALDIIMRQYSSDAFTYPESALEKILVIKVNITELTGKAAF